jgi:hypothetical protein
MQDPEKAKIIVGELLRGASRQVATQALVNAGNDLKQQHEVVQALIACAKSLLDSEKKEQS